MLTKFTAVYTHGKLKWSSLLQKSRLLEKYTGKYTVLYSSTRKKWVLNLMSAQETYVHLVC
jgi:hypothetical protein